MPTDQVRLLLRPAFVHPFKPVVDRDDCPVRPDRAEEWAVGNFLYPGIDWRGAVLGPVRAPSPANHVGVQVFTFLMEDRELSCRRSVVTLERLITRVVDQRVGHAQRRHEVVDAIILGKSSAHSSPPIRFVPPKIDRKAI
ncbi:hypothetical protein D3C73_1383690 [compost metagenome]